MRETATPRQLAMARRIFARHRKWEREGHFWQGMWEGLENCVFDNEPDILAILAAIIETTEAAAAYVAADRRSELAKRHDWSPPAQEHAQFLAAALRAGDHLNV